jgi:cation diffusion facilitator CzcD-associated flavoprotein CzcO
MPGDMPWPEVKVGNANHADTAVLIVGAGISGICTAIDLVKRNNCRNFVIVEKSGGVGGTWHDNKYPGCCCDVWSALYSLSYEQNCEWTREYPGQEEILAYLVGVAQKYKIYEHVRFNTSVENAVWNEETKRWHVDVKTAEGSKDAEFSPAYQIKTDFLVSAVGQLNQPKWPEIDGIGNFVGKKMHSARWDWSYDLKDKKIAVLGNGISFRPILTQHRSNIVKVALPPKLPPKSPKWPRASPSSNAHPTGSSLAATLQSRPSGAVYTNTSHPSAGAVVQR